MNARLAKIQNWPELARQTNWSAAALANHCGVSGETLRKHFIKQMGKPPKVWLVEQRQHQAIELLRDGSSIKETAAYLGYKQQSNFTRQYKEFWGACPSVPPSAQLIPGSKVAEMINNLRK